MQIDTLQVAIAAQAATPLEQHLLGFVFKAKVGDGLQAAIGHENCL